MNFSIDYIVYLLVFYHNYTCQSNRQLKNRFSCYFDFNTHPLYFYIPFSIMVLKLIFVAY